MSTFRFPADHFSLLIQALTGRGYQVVGPTVRDQAIVYDTITNVEQLPIGISDIQEKGHYRLEQRQDKALFGYNVGPDSWKKFLFPPNKLLWRTRLEDNQLKIQPEEDRQQPFAFIGVRACELAAIAVQDRVFIEGSYTEPSYRQRRRDALLIAVDCTAAGNTCFCTSMGTGPKADNHCQLALTEVLDDQQHFFIARSYDPIADSLLSEIKAKPAQNQDLERAMALVDHAAANMGRRMQTKGLPQLLARTQEDPYWEEIGARCLNCTNCTMVCPTCFCFTFQDKTDLTDTLSERYRQWDSCFNISHSYIHGGAIRRSNASRYRQWLTHKLSTWRDQFGQLGCIGCGRCITWCPTGIDITEEVTHFQETES